MRETKEECLMVRLSDFELLKVEKEEECEGRVCDSGFEGLGLSEEEEEGVRREDARRLEGGVGAFWRG